MSAINNHEGSLIQVENLSKSFNEHLALDKISLNRLKKENLLHW